MSMPDLVTAAQSRIVTIDVATLTEDAPKSGSITFTLPCDLRVPGGDQIIAAGATTVTLVDGRGQVRLPTVAAGVEDDAGDSWVILVKKSWSPQPYGIRVPTGTGTISLGDIAPARPLTRRETLWAVTSASVSVQSVAPTAPAGGSVALNGGTLSFSLQVPRGEQGLPGPGAVAADTAVATYVGTTSATSAALDKSYRRGYSPREFGVTGNGTTDDTTALRAMLTAIPAGARIDCPPGDKYRLTGALTLAKPVHIVGGSWQPLTDGSTIIVAASGVTLEDMAFPGSGTLANIDAQRFITTAGTKATPINNLTIRDCTFYGTQHSFMWLEWVTRSRIIGNKMNRFLYAGLMLISPVDVAVEGNTVENGHIIAPVVNCYPLCATDLTNVRGDHAQDVRFVGNYVANTLWNGIDSHGGEAIQVIGNTIRKCRTGIAVTIGNSSRVVAPTRAVIVGNRVEADGLDPADIWRGIIIDGWPGNLADGTVQGNSVRGYPDRRSISLLNVDRTRTRCSGNTSPEEPWTDLPLDPGWSPYPAPNQPQYKVEDDRVHFRGIATLNDTAAGRIGTIRADGSNRSGWTAGPVNAANFAVIGTMMSTGGHAVTVRAVVDGAETAIRTVYTPAAWLASSTRDLVLSGSYPIH